MVVATRRERLSFISRVPDDVLIEIYNYVPLRERIRSQRVCRRFRNVLSGRGFKDGTKFSYLFLEYLVPACEWEKVFRYSRINRFPLWDHPFTAKDLVYLESFFTSLGHVLTEMDVATNFPSSLMERSWESALQHCSQLKKLKIASDDELFVTNLPRIRGKFQKLTEIAFVGIRQHFTPENPELIRVESVYQFLCHQSKLRVFELYNMGSLDSFLLHLPQSLEELNICKRRSPDLELSWRVMEKFKERCPRLKKLRIEFVTIMDDDAVDDCPFDMFDRLESLKFIGFGFKTLAFRHMPALTECVLGSTWLRQLTDTMSLTLETLCVAAPNLVVLAIAGIDVPSHSLREIGKLKSLKKLDVTHVTNFNDDALVAIAAHGLLTHISMCSASVSNDGIQTLLRSCEQLVFIDLSLTGFLDEGARCLGEWTKRLKKRLRVQLTCDPDEEGERLRFGEYSLKDILYSYKLVDIVPPKTTYV